MAESNQPNPNLGPDGGNDMLLARVSALEGRFSSLMPGSLTQMMGQCVQILNELEELKKAKLESDKRMDKLKEELNENKLEVKKVQLELDKQIGELKKELKVNEAEVKKFKLEVEADTRFGELKEKLNVNEAEVKKVKFESDKQIGELKKELKELKEKVEVIQTRPSSVDVSLQTPSCFGIGETDMEKRVTELQMALSELRAQVEASPPPPLNEDASSQTPLNFGISIAEYDMDNRIKVLEKELTQVKAQVRSYAPAPAVGEAGNENGYGYALVPFPAASFVQGQLELEPRQSDTGNGASISDNVFKPKRISTSIPCGEYEDAESESDDEDDIPLFRLSTDREMSDQKVVVQSITPASATAKAKILPPRKQRPANANIRLDAEIGTKKIGTSTTKTKRGREDGGGGSSTAKRLRRNSESAVAVVGRPRSAFPSHGISPPCRSCGKTFSTLRYHRVHEASCKANPRAESSTGAATRKTAGLGQESQDQSQTILGSSKITKIKPKPQLSVAVPRPESLTIHSLRLHGDRGGGAKSRGGTCTICGKFLWDKLQRHMGTHEGKSLYPCVICSKKFRREDELKNHLKTLTHGWAKAAFNIRQYNALAITP